MNQLKQHQTAAVFFCAESEMLLHSKSLCSWCNGSSDRSLMVELFLIQASAPRLV